MEFKLKNRVVKLLKSHLSADYEYRTVLSNSTFEYVELWLRSQKGSIYNDSLFYWRQAHHFHLASEKLPIEAKPLTAYYCIMNATKALLAIKGVQLTNISHGVSSARLSMRGSIRQDKITFCAAGVLNELSKYLGEDVSKQSYTVFDLLYNIPCVHRAFTISFKDVSELFVPIENVVFETFRNKKYKRNDCFIRFSINSRYKTNSIIRNLPSNIEHVTISNNDFFRLKKRFSYPYKSNPKYRIKELSKYHRKYRKLFYYIAGERTLWYVKKNLNNPHVLDRHSLTLIYGVMHWLSELVRYSPQIFTKIMDSKQNWLIQEFMNTALDQFLDQISSEITGADILCTGVRKN